jgi:hypothetical protein
MTVRILIAAIAGVALLNGCEAKKPEPPPAPVVETWRYSHEIDQMTGKPIYMACLRSNNEVKLSPPYKPVKAVLCLQRHPRSDTSAVLRLDGEGQIVCPASGPCLVGSRFDDDHYIPLKADRATDGSTNVIGFSDLVDSTYLSAAVAQSNTSRLEVEFYRDGRQVLIFNTQGLDFTKTGWDGKS